MTESSILSILNGRFTPGPTHRLSFLFFPGGGGGIPGRKKKKKKKREEGD